MKKLVYYNLEIGFDYTCWPKGDGYEGEVTDNPYHFTRILQYRRMQAAGFLFSRDATEQNVILNRNGAEINFNGTYLLMGIIPIQIWSMHNSVRIMYPSIDNESGRGMIDNTALPYSILDQLRPCNDHFLCRMI